MSSKPSLALDTALNNTALKFWQHRSIQRTLLLWSFLLLLAVGAFTSAKLSHSLRQEMLELIDANLIQYANSLSMLAQQIQGYDHVSTPRDEHGDDDEDEDDGHKNPSRNKGARNKPTFNNAAVAQYANEYSNQFQIWDVHTNQLIIRSANAPQTPIISNLNTNTGFISQGDWRIYAYEDNDKQRLILVAQEQKLSQHLIHETLLRLLTPIVLGFLFLLLLFYFIIKRGLRPLSQLNRAIAQRSPLNLNPIELQQPPAEITPVMQSVNTLMGQLEDSLNKERHFTGNAAHELRTPLAVINTLTQAALKTQDLSILPKIKNATDHARRQIEQLLTLARVDAHAGLGKTQSINLYTTCQTVCADLIHLYPKNIDLQLHGDTHAQIHSNNELLYILLKNIIDNALTHTPKQGTIRIDIQATPYTSIQICDTGTGIAQEQLQHITERFYRAEQNHQGFGIGLSIVQRICQLHQAELNIRNRDDGQTGLCVRINFVQSGNTH